MSPHSALRLIVAARVALVVVYLGVLGGFVAVLVPARAAHQAAWAAYNQRVERARAWATVVYVTPSGDRYHTSGHYAGRSSPMSYFDARAKHLTACQVCHPQASAEDPGQPPEPRWWVDGWPLVIALGTVPYALGSVVVWAKLREIRDEHARNLWRESPPRSFWRGFFGTADEVGWGVHLLLLLIAIALSAVVGWFKAH